jgi:hypothetical protein
MYNKYTNVTKLFSFTAGPTFLKDTKLWILILFYRHLNFNLKYFQRLNELFYHFSSADINKEFWI